MFYSHTPQPPLLLFAFLPMQATPDTFHLLNSHWMENSWIRDCPEHIMPNPSMNSHLPLPFLSLSSALPCSPSSFKVGLCSWNKRKTACMRTCFSPIWYSLPLLFSVNSFPNPCSLVTLWCYGWFCFWQAENAEILCSWLAWPRMHKAESCVRVITLPW